MKLPICYLIDNLSEYLEEMQMEDENVGYLVRRPIFLTDETILKGGYLYLNTRPGRPDYRMEMGAFLIAEKQAFHTFCLKPGKNILKLNNRIHQLFDEAETWFEQMKMYKKKNGNLLDVLKLASKYLPRYMAVMNPDFLIVERYLGDAEVDDDIHGETGYLKMDIVNALKQDGCYDAVADYKNAFLYSSHGLKNRFLCVNLLEDGLFRGRISLREQDGKEFRSWEGFFLELVRDAIMPVYLRVSKMQEDNVWQRAFVKRLLEGKGNYRKDLYFFLKHINWKEKEKYICACMQMEQTDVEKETMEYYAKEIEYHIKETVCVPFDHCIYLLHRVYKDEKKEQEAWGRLNYFIRESNFRVGMSRVVTDITKACYARCQAQIALNFGMSCDLHRWKHSFDDAVLPYMAQCCLNELPASYVGNNVFTVLREWDENMSSNLHETLVCYIRFDFNMVQAANALFIHRGTLIYRLNKIQELTGIKWDSWKEKMYLAWSVMLFEYANTEF